ncbi:hypothetical protein A8B82_15120 [Sulfitobacter sp. EhC04]|nr:hypothetical protein A8B82_15120 [Sulfitobacter sp. EhC04]
MPMFWDAYIADTTHLSTEEHGAYLLLIAAMWRRNGWVPDDDRDNARITGLSAAKWKRTKARIAPMLIFERDEISQKKVLEIWQNTQEKIDKNRKNGAKGGRPVLSKNKDLAKANGFENENPIETIPEPEPEPLGKEEPNGSSKKTDPEILPAISDPKTTTRSNPRGTRLADDWHLPKEWGDWAVSEGWAVDAIREEAAKFKDYWIAKPGAPGRKSDWKATWRNWMRNSKTPKMEAVDGNGNITPHNPRRGPAGGNVHQAQADAFLDAALRRRN